MKEQKPESGKNPPAPQSDCRKSVTFADEKGETQAWDDYWEDMLLISRGPRGWNIGCA